MPGRSLPTCIKPTCFVADDYIPSKDLETIPRSWSILFPGSDDSEAVIGEVISLPYQLSWESPDILGGFGAAGNGSVASTLHVFQNGQYTVILPAVHLTHSRT